MNIDAMRNSRNVQSSAIDEVETLESRVLHANPDMAGGKRPDPEFDRLYHQLLSMEGQGEKVIYEYLRSLRGEGGVTPAYPSAKALLAVTLQVLVKLKEEGLEKSQLFKEVKGANGLAFAMDVFVKGYLRDVFQPMEDDAWEKSEW